MEKVASEVKTDAPLSGNLAFIHIYIYIYIFYPSNLLIGPKHRNTTTAAVPFFWSFGPLG